MKRLLVLITVVAIVGIFINVSYGARGELNIGNQWANCGDVGVKIPICLVNLEDEVGAVQLDLCEDINDCLICVGCEMTERTTIFDCMVNELDNGCCAVVVFSKNPGGVINPGECDIVIIDYTLKDDPECCNSCIEINAENVEVVDQYGYLVDTEVGNVGMICPFECGDVEPAATTAASWDCGDGDVDIFDILEEVDFIIHVKDPDDCQAIRADVPTGTPPYCDPPDGSIEVGDLMVIIDMALGRQDCCSYYEGVFEESFASAGCTSGSGFTTGERTIISDSVSRVYYLKLPEGYNSNTPYPLVFGFHGTGGSYTSFSEGYYNLQDVVGEEAILVYPNALLNNNDVAQWNYDTDLIFFNDLYQELESNLCFDVRKVFATGHSSGGGITHFLGCQRGDILRAIAPVAGGLLDYSSCTGQVAVIQIQGINDTFVPPGMVEPGRDYWIGINSCSSGQTHQGVDPECDAYDDCDFKFPVQYCEHSGGHEWPDFASDAIWTFFKNLPLAKPSSETGTGEIPNYTPGIISFKIHYPSDFVGTPFKLALSLYPPDTTQPIYTSPTYILNFDIPIGDYQFGEITEYNDIPVNLFGVGFDDYTLSVVVYVEGGNYPIPTTGVDYTGLQNITLDSNTMTVETPFELEFVDSF